MAENSSPCSKGSKLWIKVRNHVNRFICWNYFKVQAEIHAHESDTYYLFYHTLIVTETVSFTLKNSQSLNGQFRSCQSWSCITVHDQNYTNKLGLYCQVTSWPSIHKRKPTSCLWYTLSQDKRKSIALGGAWTVVDLRIEKLNTTQ